jgi:hypothetical protein
MANCIFSPLLANRFTISFIDDILAKQLLSVDLDLYSHEITLHFEHPAEQEASDKVIEAISKASYGPHLFKLLAMEKANDDWVTYLKRNVKMISHRLELNYALNKAAIHEVKLKVC